MTECLITWTAPHAVAAIAIRIRQLLDAVVDPIRLVPACVELHVARPLPDAALFQMIDDGHRTQVNVEPEFERHRAASAVLDQLSRLRFDVPVSLIAGESRYRGIGVHAKRGARLAYNLSNGGLRREPVVTQAAVDSQMAVSMIQACIAPARPQQRRMDSAVVLMTVDRDMSPIVRLLRQCQRDCHIVHYSNAKLPRSLADAAASVTTVPGLRLSIDALERRAERRREFDALKA